MSKIERLKRQVEADLPKTVDERRPLYAKDWNDHLAPHIDDIDARITALESAPGGGGGETLDETLAIDNQTLGKDIVLSIGDEIRSVPAPTNGARIFFSGTPGSESMFIVNNVGTTWIQTNADINILSGIGKITLNASGDIDFILGGGSDLNITGLPTDVTAIGGATIVTMVGNKIAKRPVSDIPTGSGDLLAANNLSDLANTATARINLGVDAAGTDNSTNVTLNADLPTQDSLNLTGQEIQAVLATPTTHGVMDKADKSKLDGIEANAKDDQSSSEVVFTPNGDIAATNVQAAIVEVRDDTDTKLADKLNKDSGVATTSLTVQGPFKTEGKTQLIQGQAGFDAEVTIGEGRTANGNAILDMISASTTGDFDFRILRSSGPNGISRLDHLGTGDFELRATNAAPITFKTVGAERMRVHSNGYVGIGENVPTSKLYIKDTPAVASPIVTLHHASFIAGNNESRITFSALTGTSSIKLHSYITAVPSNTSDANYKSKLLFGVHDSGSLIEPLELKTTGQLHVKGGTLEEGLRNNSGIILGANIEDVAGSIAYNAAKIQINNAGGAGNWHDVQTTEKVLVSTVSLDLPPISSTPTAVSFTVPGVAGTSSSVTCTSQTNIDPVGIAYVVPTGVNAVDVYFFDISGGGPVDLAGVRAFNFGIINP